MNPSSTNTKRLRTKGLGSRKHIRFSPDHNTLAWVDLHPILREFDPTIVSLVFSESYWGCGIVICGRSQEFTVGKQCTIKVGKLSPLIAEVRWIKMLGNGLTGIGFKYIKDSR